MLQENFMNWIKVEDLCRPDLKGLEVIRFTEEKDRE